MDFVRQVALSFPVVVFSVLIPLVLFYWLLVLLRLAPLGLFERDSLKGDHLASSMVALGFAGMPITVVLSALVILAGIITLVVELAVLRWLSLGLFRAPVGVAVLWASFAIASPLIVAFCNTLHRWFHRHAPQQRRSLLGERVQVLDPPDADGWTRATLVDDPDHEVRLHGKPGNMPDEGKTRVLVKYVEADDAYRSVAEESFREARAYLSRLQLRRGATSS